VPSLGYRRKLVESFKVEGYNDPEAKANEFFRRVERWCEEVTEIGQEEFSTPDSFMQLFNRMLDNEVERLATTTK
jgi:hypothetical protein